MPSSQSPRLDDLYRMVAYIYGDKINSRTTAATFSHLVEVCGMLTIHDRNKKREGLDVADALCKALGWYFPLLAKFRIRSVEALVFRKFPGVCPYCREAPHNEAKCKLVKGTASTVNHEELARIFGNNYAARPNGLNEWQQMFQKIYPRQLSDRGRSTVGLLEELGELAEAVRVGEVHPKYFLGEAADIFSYIMGIANEHTVRIAQENDQHFSYEAEFLKRYPGLCTQCGHTVCICPSIPQATIGRMAKEINISPDERPFIDDADAFLREGKTVAHDVLELLGGYNGLTAQLPLDRGDANRAVLFLCNGIADAVDAAHPDLAATLRAEAFRLGANSRSPGTVRQPLNIDELLRKVSEGWGKLTNAQKDHITAAQGELVRDFGDILDAVRVLFVHCSPHDAEHVHVAGELRTVRQSAQHGSARIIVEDLPAATIDDLRTKLLHSNAPYNVVHFAGHADQDSLVFEDAMGKAHAISLEAISELLRRQNINCVILNGCSTAKKLTKAISPYTIGMSDDTDDETASEFSRGFYDALSARKSFEEAYVEGLSAVKLQGKDASKFVLLKDK